MKGFDPRAVETLVWLSAPVVVLPIRLILSPRSGFEIGVLEMLRPSIAHILVVMAVYSL
jgi:hypothetical protein